MSINSSPFHTQSQNNYKQNMFLQDFRYQEQPKEIFNNNNNNINNQMANSMNLYNQYHSPLSISKDELNSQIFPVISNKEKRTEIELNMVIIKSDKIIRKTTSFNNSSNKSKRSSIFIFFRFIRNRISTIKNRAKFISRFSELSRFHHKNVLLLQK